MRNKEKLSIDGNLTSRIWKRLDKSAGQLAGQLAWDSAGHAGMIPNHQFGFRRSHGSTDQCHWRYSKKETFLCRLKSCTERRVFQVRCGSSISSSRPIRAGVAQGSVLECPADTRCSANLSVDCPADCSSNLFRRNPVDCPRRSHRHHPKLTGCNGP